MEKKNPTIVHFPLPSVKHAVQCLPVDHGLEIIERILLERVLLIILKGFTFSVMSGSRPSWKESLYPNYATLSSSVLHPQSKGGEF